MHAILYVHIHAIVHVAYTYNIEQQQWGMMYSSKIQLSIS